MNNGNASASITRSAYGSNERPLEAAAVGSEVLKACVDKDDSADGADEDAGDSEQGR